MVRSHCVPHMLYIALPNVPSCTLVPWHSMGLCGTIPLCTTHALADPSVPSCTHVPYGTSWDYVVRSHCVPHMLWPIPVSHPVLMYHNYGTSWDYVVRSHCVPHMLKPIPVSHPVLMYHGTLWDCVVRSHCVPHLLYIAQPHFPILYSCTIHALADPSGPSCTLVPWYSMGLCGTIPLCTTHALYCPSHCPVLYSCTMVHHGTMWYDPSVYHTCCSRSQCLILYSCTMVHHGSMWYNPTVYHTCSIILSIPVSHPVLMYRGTAWDYVVRSHCVPHMLSLKKVCGVLYYT